MFQSTQITFMFSKKNISESRIDSISPIQNKKVQVAKSALIDPTVHSIHQIEYLPFEFRIFELNSPRMSKYTQQT